MTEKRELPWWQKYTLTVLDFLDMSYDLIDGAGGKEENVSGLQ